MTAAPLQPAPPHADPPHADPPPADPPREEHAREAALVAMLHVHWFIKLRWIFIAGAVTALAIEHFAGPAVDRPLGLGLTLLALGLANLIWMWRSRLLFAGVHDDHDLVPARLSAVRRFTNLQVAFDIVMLTVLLRYTGGVENPMSSFYLFHMAIVALLLKRTQALLHGALAVAAFAALALGELSGAIRPHFSLMPHTPSTLYQNTSYVLGCIVVLVVGVFGMLYFTLFIARRLEQREEQLRASYDALRHSQLAIKELQHRRSRFMQTAAHQLKSPLATIHTLTDLIRNHIVPGEAVPGTCDRIIHRCQCGISQVSELLTLARVQESDPRRHSESRACVRDVLEALIRELGPMAEEKHQCLTLRYNAQRPLYVHVERHDLNDCFGNLIENAIKYTPADGRVSVTIHEEHRADQAFVVIAVADTGIGIDPELLEPAPGSARGDRRLFDAFRRGNNVLEAGIPGSGLGMSIVQEVVEQAHGHVDLETRAGQGTTFTVTLPAAEVPPPSLLPGAPAALGVPSVSLTSRP